MTTHSADDNLSKRVLAAAYRTAPMFAPAHTNTTGPRKFTQHQLIAILTLKEFLGSDYRSVTALLEERADLRQAIQLSQVPHWTTLHKAAARGAADLRSDDSGAV